MKSNTTSLDKTIELLKNKLDDYQRLFNNADIAILIIDFNGTYLDYNKAYFQLMGYSGKDPLEKFHPENVSPESQPDGQDSYDKANKMINLAISNKKHSFEWMHRTPDGLEFLSYVTLELIIFGGQEAIQATIFDISEQKKLERLIGDRTKELIKKNQELEYLAVTDRLTNLFNRVKLDEVLIKEKQRYDRYKHLFGIILLDLDYFKHVNDYYGHQVGDQILVEISKILIKHLRKVDTIGRWGGEEFLIILPDNNLTDIKMVAEKLRKNIENYPFPKVKSITASFGVAIIKKDENIKNLFSRVDDALYKAKRNGRNLVEIAL